MQPFFLSNSLNYNDYEPELPACDAGRLISHGNERRQTKVIVKENKFSRN